ncbi:MAG: hypothetical protein OEZ06_02895 [Myxococcales bacterium]|nr:hypothetical protein [Myxococcales bacterium]
MSGRAGLLACYRACFVGSVSLLVLGWLASLPGAEPWPGVAHPALLPLYGLELLGLYWLWTRGAPWRVHWLLGAALTMLALGVGLAGVVSLSLLGPLARNLALAAALLFAGLLGAAALTAGPLGAVLGFFAFAVIASYCALSMGGMANALPLLHWLVIYPLANTLARYPAWLGSRHVALRLQLLLASGRPLGLATAGRWLSQDLALNLVAAAAILGLLIPLGELTAMGFGWLLGRPLDGPVAMRQVVAGVLEAPLGAGLWISVMLLSNLSSTVWLGARALGFNLARCARPPREARQDRCAAAAFAPSPPVGSGHRRRHPDAQL